MAAPFYNRHILDTHPDRRQLYRSLLADPYVDVDLYWYMLKTHNFPSTTASKEAALLSVAVWSFYCLRFGQIRRVKERDIQDLAKPFAAQDFLAHISESLLEGVLNCPGSTFPSGASKAPPQPDPDSVRLELEFSYRLHPTTAAKTVAARALLAGLEQEGASGDLGAHWNDTFDPTRSASHHPSTPPTQEILLLAFVLSHDDQKPPIPTPLPPLLHHARAHLTHHILSTISDPRTPTVHQHPYLIARACAHLPALAETHTRHLLDATLVNLDSALCSVRPAPETDGLERSWLALLHATGDAPEFVKRHVGPALRTGFRAVREQCLKALEAGGVDRDVVLEVAEAWAGMFARLAVDMEEGGDEGA
ncbi:hypothetical protein BC936DRAFT_139593 [Jimgerdemannia flammicorona]|uniref:Uncharacterized protein n=1 Tax=Jimgerdemannia flammicorona TaxID=994334 RepID=A0A433DHJ1_9FUNG|nr:hypothetical protein BC936DRAFT_139593 [Jimgerdemannia flammicorona]